LAARDCILPVHSDAMPDFAGSAVAHGKRASLGCDFIVIGGVV